MQEINKKVIDLAIAIVETLRDAGHTIGIDGDIYVVQGISSTKCGKNTHTKELWCGSSQCKPIDALNVIQRYHNAMINM